MKKLIAVVFLAGCGVPVDTECSRLTAHCDAPGGNTTPTPTYSYRLGTDVIRTGWSGPAVSSSYITSSSCPELFIAMGVFGNVSRDSLYPDVYKLSHTGVTCVQLKTGGPANLTSDSTTWASSSYGDKKSSWCASKQAMVGVAYDNEGSNTTLGLAANCVDFDQWMDPTASPKLEQSTGPLGRATLPSQLNCPQGYVLTGLEGDRNDIYVSVFRAVCTSVTRTAQ